MNNLNNMAQKMLNNMLQNNPAARQAMPFIQGKSPQQLEQTARNLCRERGLDVDQMLQQVQSMVYGQNRK